MIACPQAEQSRKRIGEAPLSVRVEDLRVPEGTIRDPAHLRVAVNESPDRGRVANPGADWLESS